MKLLSVAIVFFTIFTINAESIYKEGENISKATDFLVEEFSIQLFNTRTMSEAVFSIQEEDEEIVATINDFKIIITTIEFNTRKNAIEYFGYISDGPLNGDAYIFISNNKAFAEIANRVKYDSLNSTVTLPYFNND